MSERQRRRSLRFLKETSDRSGFDNWERNREGTFKKVWQSIKQGGLKLEPSEFDMPPPSKKSLGGADISGEPRANWDDTDVPSGCSITVQYLAVDSQVTQSLNDGEVAYITGSNGNVTLTSDPQFVAGASNQIMTVIGVGSNVVLTSGNGLALRTSTFLMDSGAILNVLYDKENTQWVELSRSHMTRSYGGF